MRSKLTENDIRHRSVVNQSPMSLLIREQHRWSTFRLKQIIRKQARAMKHMERTKTMTCFACFQPGRYLEVDIDNFIYRMAHRALCCGYFMHRYCAINSYNVWNYCYQCGTILFQGEVLFENEPHFVTKARNVHRRKKFN